MGGFLGRSASMMSSARAGWELEIWDLIPRWTDALTWVDVLTSFEGSNFLNMLMDWSALLAATELIFCYQAKNTIA